MPRRATIAEGCGGLPPFSETSLARAHGKTFQNGPKPSATLSAKLEKPESHPRYIPWLIAQSRNERGTRA
jgi:hypothetical protein